MRTPPCLWLTLSLALATSFAGCHRGKRPVRIASGLPGGTFLPLAQQLAAAFNRDVPAVDARALEVSGGLANLAMLEKGEAELALVSNHLEGGSAVRLIAPLYEETLQVVVRRDARIATPLDLRGKRVSIGPAGSGTEQISRQVLGHFGVEDGGIAAQNLSPRDAKTALEAGRLDAAFIVGGLRTPVVDQLLHEPDMHLLQLGDATRRGSSLDGIRLDAPYLQKTVVPQFAYGSEPPEPIGTIGVKALLVARADLPVDLVEQLTRSLFDGKVQLVQQQKQLAALSEKFDALESPFPLHEGADLYYRRAEPSFIVRNGDQISLALTVGALVWSALSGLRAWRRSRRKGRIESFLRDAERVSSAVGAEGTAEGELRAARGELGRIQGLAMTSLVDEKLDANEAFVIFQRYVDDRIAEIDRRLATPPGV